MKLVAFLVALSLTVLTTQSPAHATATASVAVSNIVCTQVTNAGTVVSTPSFSTVYSTVGVIGLPNSGITGLSFGPTCSADLAQGESLTMSAHVILTVQDQGLSGAGGGEIIQALPYNPFGSFPVVPSGFEFAYAATDISIHADQRDPSHWDERISQYSIHELQTTQDAFADTVTSSGILESTVVPAGFPFANSGAHASLQLFASLWAVSGVPEPENYAMLLAGLGLIGFVARRRVLAKED